MLLISGIVATLGGIIALFFSIFGNKGYYNKKERCTAITEGTIIRFEIRRHKYNNNGTRYYDVVYYPIYEYFVNDNKYEVMQRIGIQVYYKETKEEKVDSLLGTKKEIFYNPNNYAESYVSGEDINFAYKTAKLLGTILLVIGIIELLIFLLSKVLI